MLDSCVWRGAGNSLRASGFDVVWAGDWPADPGDEGILARAFSDGRVLVTLDKDFGELAVRKGTGHRGIVRLVGFRAREIGPACVEVLRRYKQELAEGALVTADPKRVRIRQRS